MLDNASERDRQILRISKSLMSGALLTAQFLMHSRQTLDGMERERILFLARAISGREQFSTS